MADEGDGEKPGKDNWWGKASCVIPASSRPPKSHFQTAAVSTLRSGRIDLNSSLFVPGTAPSAPSSTGRIPIAGVPETAHERTFLLLHPAAVRRGLVATILARFELAALKVVAMRMEISSVERAKALYQSAAMATPLLFPAMVRRLISGPTVAIVLEGADVVSQSLEIVGGADPFGSKRGGTVRGDLCTDPGENLLHVSSTPSAAAREIGLWFVESEIADAYTRVAPDALTAHLS
jgi:nucleoside-diphosphate kinase